MLHWSVFVSPREHGCAEKVAELRRRFQVRGADRHNTVMAARLIYSTGLGSLCPNCRRPVRECVCPKGAPGAAKPTAVRVGREIKGRAGNGVTTITGLPMPPAEIESLAAKLKKRCGSGGTVRDGVIEIQGDHRDSIVAELTKLGWPAKKSGG
jgi:translation initiation factor 1